MSDHPRKSNFTIEPLKNPVILDPGYADETWKMLEHGIRKILNNNYDGLSFEVLHRNAYNMALHGFGEKLYSGLVTTLTRHLKMVERRLREEKERASHYLDDSTEPKIISIVEEEMIAKHMRRLVHMNSGLVSMLLRDEYEDLGRMYSLLRRCTGGVSTIRDLMTSHLRETGKQLVTDADSSRNPVDLVQRLLDTKDKYDRIIAGVFGDDKTFQTAVSTSFEYFINLNSRSAEFISLYVDDTLRMASEEAGGKEDVEIVLHKVMTLFRYLQEKDVFEKYHRQHLANRLLSGRAVSDDAERSLIAKLGVECGYNFTSKLEQMLTDIKLSQGIIRGFYASQGVDEEAGEGPTLAAQVLTGAIWPTRPSTACKLPHEMHDAWAPPMWRPPSETAGSTS